VCNNWIFNYLADCTVLILTVTIWIWIWCWCEQKTCSESYIQHVINSTKTDRDSVQETIGMFVNCHCGDQLCCCWRWLIATCQCVVTVVLSGCCTINQSVGLSGTPTARTSMWYVIVLQYVPSVGCWRGYRGWGADFHMAQQMPLSLTISCSSKSRLVLPSWFLPFWYLLTWVVPDKFQKSSKMIVCVCVPSVLWHCWLGGRKGIQPVKNWVVGCCVVMCLGQGADLRMVQLRPLSLTISCSSKCRLVLPFWCRLTWVVPDEVQRGRKIVACVCVCYSMWQTVL